MNPDSVLEIGAAYGRVMKKLMRELPDPKIMGIEICEHFEKFRNEFLREHADKLVFGDVFTTDLGKFDVVVLPMNTMPGFPPEMVPKLLCRVRELLNTDGTFVFFLHKFKEKIVMKSRETSSLIDTLGINAKFTSTTPVLVEEGWKIGTEHLFMDRQPVIYQTATYIFKDEFYMRLLENEGWHYNADRSSHSNVWICTLSTNQYDR